MPSTGALRRLWYGHRIPPETPPVLLDWKISTDPMNQTSTWLMHRFYTEKNLKDEYRVKGMMYAYLIMQVRMLTSKIRVHWVNPCRKDTKPRLSILRCLSSG